MMRAAFVIGVLCCAAVDCAWADATSQTATAMKFAYTAAQADTIAEAHANLHRVVNCLVGPADELFDGKQGNPCAKDGKGAIPDTKDPAQKKSLRDAVDMAEMGIASDDLGNTVMLATGVVGSLRASNGR